MNRHALVRGSLLFTIVLLFSQLIFVPSLHPAAAQSNLSAGYWQYLPIILRPDCIPRPLILPNDLARDQAMEDAINNLRSNRGLSLLKHSDKIAQAALRHSNDMAHNGFVDTVGSDGSESDDRLNDTCYRWRESGEVVVGGARSPAEAIAAWLGIPDDENPILLNEYSEFGAAYAYKKNTLYKHYYTVDLGLPDSIRNNSSSGIYYSCSYSMMYDGREIQLQIRSQVPCDQFFELSAGRHNLK